MRDTTALTLKGEGVEAVIEVRMTTPLGDENELDARLESVLAEYLRAVEAKQPVDQESFIAGHPEIAEELRAFFANHAALERVTAPLRENAVELTLALPSVVNDDSRLKFVGDYELLGEIARGGMGVVYRARQVSLNRPVAVKMIIAGQLADESAIRRFRQEAEAAASLDHPHIVPIYEVGEHAGQQYFSMGLVEGSSLAARVAAGPMPAREAAELVRTVAAAVQFAHERGVIHRDLKPANILLDAQGRPRVTDFGLAKRTSDGNSLTETGQVLGTPSYMPPEQVQAKEIGPTADVYALGAILYALLTGRAPFAAATAMETMLQVLAAEPVSPRQLIPNLPRDLETIVLKCLEKQTTWRYATAAELVAELDRFLAGEPIRARRPGVVEQGVRWLARQQRSVALAIIVAIGTAGLVIGGIVGTAVYRKSLEGQLLLDTEHPRLIAEILTPAGDKVLPAFTVPTQQSLPLTAGEYVIRAAGKDFLSEDFHVRIERGQPQQLKLSLDTQTLWPTEQIIGASQLIPGKDGSAATLLDLHEGGLKLSSPTSKPELWSRKFQPLEDEKLKAIPRFDWQWSNSETGSHVRNYRPFVVLPPPHLNDDRQGDIVLACRHHPVLIAINGNDGKTLWAYAPQELNDIAQRLAARPASSGPWPRTGAVIAPPLVLPDLDGDGVVDFIIAALLVAADLKTDKPQPQRVIDAVSGKTGQRLWSYPLPTDWFQLMNVSDIPRGATWLLRGSGTGGGGHIMHPYGNTFREFCQDKVFGEQIAVPYAPQPIRVKGEEVISCVAGTRLIFLDPKTGKENLPPQTPSFFPHIEPRVVHQQGAGQDDALLLAQEINETRRAKTAMTGHGLVLWSPAEGKPIWQRAIYYANYNKDTRAYQPLPRWPLVADLNGDGTDEVITADGTSLDQAAGFYPAESTRAWGGLTLLGKTQMDAAVWKCKLETVDQQVDQCTVGPDINGDGWRDVFAANIFARGYDSARVYVDAISGKTGEILWSSGELIDLRQNSQVEHEVVGDIRWWNESQLIVPVLHGQEGKSAGLFIFSAIDGRFLRQASDLILWQIADGDGDGLDDLFFMKPTDRTAGPIDADRGGQLISIRGETPAAWKQSGSSWQAGDDYNGDGQADAINRQVEYVAGKQLIAARSGTDGQILFHTAARTAIWVGAEVVPLHADLNGDQVADFVAVDSHRGGSSGFGTPAIHAFSGKTGRELWIPTVNVRLIKQTLLIEACDLDQDGRGELIHIAELDLATTPSAAPASNPPLCLVVMDGMNGQLRWHQQLNDRSLQTGQSQTLAIATGDLNHDGTLDIIVPAVIVKNQCPELRAYDGKTGKQLLSDLPLPGNGGQMVIEHMPIPVAADITGDGRPEILVQDFFRPDELQNRAINSYKRVEDRISSPTEAAAAGRQFTSRLHCFDEQGKTLWTYDTPTGGAESQVYDGMPLPHFRSRPLIVARGNGEKPAICIWLWGADWRKAVGKIILLNHEGHELWQHAVQTPIGNRHFRPWNLDVNGDGREEILFVDHEGMTALDIDTHEPLWQKNFTTMNCTPLGVYPGDEKIAPHLVVVVGRQVRAWGGPTGELAWSCSGLPQPHQLLELPRDTQLLARRGGLPQVLWSKGPEAVCFTSQSVLGSAQAKISKSPVSIAKRDLRFQRPLPWINAGDHPFTPFGRPVTLLAGLFYTLALALFPGYLLWQMSWRRQWSLGFFLLIPVAVGLLLFAFQQPFAERPSSATAAKLWLATFGLPAVLGVIFITRWLLQGRWHLPLSYFALLVIWSGVLITSWLALDLRHCSPLEYYSWDRWWVVLVMAAHSTAVFVTFSTAAITAWRWTRALWVAKKPTR